MLTECLESVSAAAGREGGISMQDRVDNGAGKIQVAKRGLRGTIWEKGNVATGTGRGGSLEPFTLLLWKQKDNNEMIISNSKFSTIIFSLSLSLGTHLINLVSTVTRR